MNGWLVALGLAVLALVGAIAFVVIDAGRKDQDRQQAAIEIARLKKDALAVPKLGIGVQKAWEQYLDDRFDQAISPKSGNLRIQTWTGVKYVSLNTPYQLECFRLAQSVRFGQGEDAPRVDIVGGFPLSAAGKSKEPPLGVDAESVAASKLSDHLCARISQRMHDLVAN